MKVKTKIGGALSPEKRRQYEKNRNAAPSALQRGVWDALIAQNRTLYSLAQSMKSPYQTVRKQLMTACTVPTIERFYAALGIKIKTKGRSK